MCSTFWELNPPPGHPWWELRESMGKAVSAVRGTDGSIEEEVEMGCPRDPKDWDR